MSLTRVALALATGLAFARPGSVRAAQAAVISSPLTDCSGAQDDGAPPARVVGSMVKECQREIEETVTRLSAELKTLGFTVVALQRNDGLVSPTPADLGIVPTPIGVFSVVRTDGTPAIEVMLTDRNTSEILRFTLRAPRGEPGRAPALLAVRALELLRANALVLDIEALTEVLPPAPPPAAVVVAEPVREPIGKPAPPAWVSTGPRFVWFVGAAAAMFYGFHKLGPALAPLVTAGVTGKHGVGARLWGAGPSLGPELRGRVGSATVSETVVACGLHYQLWPSERFALEFTLGAGAHHLNVRGHAMAPLVAEHRQVWTALGTAGVGASFRLWPRIFLTLDLLALGSFPRAVVLVDNQEVGSVSRPSTLSALGLRVSP